MELLTINYGDSNDVIRTIKYRVESITKEDGTVIYEAPKACIPIDTFVHVYEQPGGLEMRGIVIASTSATCTIAFEYGKQV